MFTFNSNNDMLKLAAGMHRQVLKSWQHPHIPVLTNDTGNSYSRTIEFYPENGGLLVKAVGKEPKNYMID